MKGQLREHPLAELIREISITGLSGALRLTHERVKMIFYFESGEIIYALTNLRQYRLCECLRRWGYEAEAAQVSVYEQSSDLEIGAALVSYGVFNKLALEDLMGRQVAEMLRPALLWIDGGWDFESRVRLSDGARARFAVHNLLLECARRLPEDFVEARVRQIGEKTLQAVNDSTATNVSPVEGFVLSRADQPVTMNELVMLCGLPEAESLRAVYALALGGLLRCEEWPCAFTAAEVSRSLAAKIAHAKTFSVAPPIAPAPAAAKEKIIVPEISATDKDELDERRELDKLFARLQGAENFYQVLNVRRDASLNEIKRAYHLHAKRFHPDLFRHHADTPLHARIGSSFAKIARAYETLKDENSRKGYDHKLARDQAAGRGSQTKR